MASFLVAHILLTADVEGAQAQTACPVQREKPMVMVEFFFGLARENHGPVTDQEWQSFVEDTLTGDFPDGLTVYAGFGQWRDPATRRIGREPSKTVVAVASDDLDLPKKIEHVSSVYKRRFEQESVGIVTQRVCGAF